MDDIILKPERIDGSELAKPHSHTVRNAALIALAVVILGSGSYIAYLRSHASKQQVYDNLAVLEARLENMDKTISLHDDRIAALETKTHGLETAHEAAPAPNAADSDRIAVLEKKLGTLSASGSAPGGTQAYAAIHLLSSFYRLNDKVVEGKPFATELAAFEEQTGNNDELEKSLGILAPYAETGMPTYATLLASFDESLDDLNIAQAAPPENATLWQRFLYNITHLIRVRKLGEMQDGTSVAAIISRAQVHLEREEIEAAASELKSLPDTARSSFSGWLDDAQMVTGTPALMDDIESQSLEEAFHAEPTMEAPKPEAAAPETPKPEATPEPVKPEAAAPALAPDAPKADATAPEPAKPEVPKAETTPETSAPETPATETDAPEITKHAAPKPVTAEPDPNRP